MSPFSRRDFLTSSIMAPAGVSLWVSLTDAKADEKRIAFYLHGADDDPTGKGFDLKNKVGISLSDDFGPIGLRSKKALILSLDTLREEVTKADQAGISRAIFWSPRRKIGSSLERDIKVQLHPVMTIDNPGSPQVYFEALRDMLEKDGLTALSSFVVEISKKEPAPIAFFVILAKIGSDYALKAYSRMDKYWCAKPVFDWATENSVLVHAFEINIGKSRTTRVANETQDGIWLQETLWFQCCETHPEHSTHDFVYYPLWKGEYSTNFPISELLGV